MANKIYMSIEQMVNDLAKSVLNDAELQKYSQQLIAAALFSATIEIKLHEMCNSILKKHSDDSSQVTPNSIDLMRCYSQIWERFV